jgi:hypothetical protein
MTYVTQTKMVIEAPSKTSWMTVLATPGTTRRAATTVIPGYGYRAKTVITEADPVEIKRAAGPGIQLGPENSRQEATAADRVEDRVNSPVGQGAPPREDRRHRHGRLYLTAVSGLSALKVHGRIMQHERSRSRAAFGNRHEGTVTR